MEEDTDGCWAEDGADVRSMLRHWGNELWFGSKEDHLVETAEEEPEERATIHLLESIYSRYGRYIELTPYNTGYIARCI